MYDHKEGASLRKIRQDDLPALLELKEESWWGTHKSTVSNPEDQQRWYSHICNSTSDLVMIAEATQTERLQPIGVALYSDIDFISRTLKLSGSIYKSCRNGANPKSGFAAGLDFAFELLNMQRVEAEVMEYNLPARKLQIDYLGFTIEGRRRKAVYKCGKYYDSLLIGILREEWLDSPRVKSYGGSCNLNFNHSLMNWMINRGSPTASSNQPLPQET